MGYKLNNNNKSNHKTIFLLYVSVMLIITFLQQEFVLLPEFQSFDLVNEESKSTILENWQKWRWLSFVFSPILLLFRLCLVSMCLFAGSFFFPEMTCRKYKDWWSVAMVAQSVMIFYSVVLCVFNIMSGTNESLEVSKCTSLLFLGGDNMEQWVKIPLSAINIFEIAYWLVMSRLVSLKIGSTFGRSFKFVMSSYGVGYLFYIALLMFLMLYLN